MTITWTTGEDPNYHIGSVAGHQWFSISHTPWDNNKPWWLATAIPAASDIVSGACTSVQAAKDAADGIVEAFLALVTPETPGV